jgi:hypothetical protein
MANSSSYFGSLSDFVRIKPTSNPLPRNKHFNRTQINSVDGRQSLLQAWQEAIHAHPNSPWTTKIKAALTAVRERNIAKAKEKKKAWRETYQSQLKEILDAELHLERNSEDPQVREALNNA